MTHFQVSDLSDWRVWGKPPKLSGNIVRYQDKSKSGDFLNTEEFKYKFKNLNIYCLYFVKSTLLHEKLMSWLLLHD
jgi:hypothetical protein